MKLTKDMLDAVMRPAFARFESPSVSLSLWDGTQEMHWSTGWSDVECAIPATEDTIYCIGSSTKAFVATAICILADEGKLSLDDPVKKHLPSFCAYDPYVTEHLTVRDMLCHRCGLPRHDMTFDNQPDLTPREMAQRIVYLKPAFPLRYRFSYQNHMYMLASVLVEDLSGQDWGAFITERILRPLHMDSTFIFGDEIPDADSRKARPYESRGETHTRLPYNYVHNAASAGSIYSTTRDMLKWLRFRLQGDPAVLSDALREEMHTPQMLIRRGEMSDCMEPEFTSSAYGLAWFVYSYRGQRIVHHGGAIDGFRSMQIFLPEKDIAISLLTNSNSSEVVNAPAYTLIDILSEQSDAHWNDRMWKKLLSRRNAFAAASDGLKKLSAQTDACPCPQDFTGVFFEKGYGTVTVVQKENQLILHMGSGDYPLLSRGDNEFLLLMEMFLFSFPVHFVRDAAGIVTAMEIPFEPQLPNDPVRFSRCCSDHTIH